MEVTKYQGIISKTAVYPEEIGLAYCSMGLTGEAGEVADKVKKLYRDKDYLNTNTISEEDKQSIGKELGDVLWYVTAAANELNISLEELMENNYKKLIKRRETGTLHGSGDNRELSN
jgi:NTP pyrophosphatase (non-canonical NTP hydrolase)